MKLTAIIVDDEPLAVEGLRLRLERIDAVDVIAEANDGATAIRHCRQLEPDILFLDLQLPDLSGLEVVQCLQSDNMPMVVFVTAHSEYAVEAFEMNAIDYILKPANLGRLEKTIEKIKERSLTTGDSNHKHRLLRALEHSSGVAVDQLEDWLEKRGGQISQLPKNELVIKNTDNEQVFLPMDDIRWIDAAGDYMCIHTQTENYIVRMTMKALEQKLHENFFQRIHKSTLVNIKSVKSIQRLRNNESLLDLGGEITLKVSRNYSDVIHKIIAQRQG